MEIDLKLFCDECNEAGKSTIHVAYSVDYEKFKHDDPDAMWSWHILSHDRSTKFTWPVEFVSNQAAKDHLNGLVGYME